MHWCYLTDSLSDSLSVGKRSRTNEMVRPELQCKTILAQQSTVCITLSGNSNMLFSCIYSLQMHSEVKTLQTVCTVVVVVVVVLWQYSTGSWWKTLYIKACWPVKVMRTVGMISGTASLGTSLGTSGSSNDVAAVRHSSVWVPTMIITAECEVGSTANFERHVFIVITIIRPQSQVKTKCPPAPPSCLSQLNLV